MSARTRFSPKTVGRAIADGGRFYAAGMGKALYTQPVFIWAQAIAFKVFITLLPLLLLASGIFGLVVRADDPFETVAGFLRGFLPAAQSEPLITLVSELQSASGGLTLVGSAAFIVTVVTLLSTVRYVIGTAMGGERHRTRSLVGGYAFDVRMAIQVGVLFLLSFGVTLGVRLLRRFGEDWGIQPGILEGVGSLLTLAVPYAITLGMLVQLYYFIPRPSPPKRSVVLGSAVAAVLFELAKNGFVLYSTYIGDFGRYANESATDGLGGIGGAFGLLLAFVFWVYLSGLILVIGAVVVALHEKRHRPRASARRRRARRRVGKAVRRRSALRRLLSRVSGGRLLSGDAPAGEGAPSGASPEASGEAPVSGAAAPGPAADRAAPEQAGPGQPAPEPTAPEAPVPAATP